MAQYFTDFSDQVADTFPSGWTAWVSATSGWIIRDLGGSRGKVLTHTDSLGTSNRKAITWDTVPLAQDVEVYMEISASTAQTSLHEKFACLRLDPNKNTSSGTATFYRLGYDEGDVAAGRYVDGSFTGIASDNDPDSGNFSSGTYVHAVRVRINGTSIKVRSWDKSTAEPSTWDIETTDSGITDSGHTGVFSFIGLSGTEWIVFGVGTGGDPAPTSEVTGGADHDLTATDIESASEVSSPAIGQVHSLSATGVESASEVSSPSLSSSSSTHDLTANDIESASEVSTPALGQVHSLSANDVESASETSSPSIGQVHALSATDVESASEVSSPTLTETAGHHSLSATGIESASEVSSPSLGQLHQLSAVGIESESEVSAPSLTMILPPGDAIYSSIIFGSIPASTINGTIPESLIKGSIPESIIMGELPDN